jgi:MFS family permease
MEAVYFTLAAIGLYVAADWLLDAYERRLGRRLPQRTIVFFVILLILALVSFAIIQYFFAPPDALS